MRTRFYPAYERGRLHPEAETVLEEIRCAPGKPLVELTPTEARADFLPSGWLGVPEPCVIIQERSIPGPAGSIPLHICGTGDGSNRPVLLFFHGGGFVLGALEEFDAFCTYLANGAGCIVVSVGYRLAPEHPFPAAVEDASAVLKWVAGHAEELGGDPGRIAVAGDSAGGNLAAVVTLLARDEQHPKLALQVLICPWVDLTAGAEETESFRWFGDGLWLSRANISWYRDHYTGSAERAHHPLVSPLQATSLRGLPPTLVLTAEFDVLADQGKAYARRLEEADVAVTFTQYKGMLHDCVVLPGRFSDAWSAIEQINQALRDAFQRRPED